VRGRPRPGCGQAQRNGRLARLSTSSHARGSAATFTALSYERVRIELSGLPPSRLKSYYAKHNWNRLTPPDVLRNRLAGRAGIAALCPDPATAGLVLAGNACRVYNLKLRGRETAVTDEGAPSSKPVSVAGTGTTGAGIAEVAAIADRRALIADATRGAAERVIAQLCERVKAQVAKGRLGADPDALLISAADLAGLADCAVVVEAIVEDPAAKKALFAWLEQVVSADCVLASNSSFSPTAMAAGLVHPERLVGLHS
jgi:hypothetical protein